MKFYLLRFAILACCSMYGASPEIEITLAHGTPEEIETRGQLQRLLNTYDLSGWTWTRKVLIDKDAIPHSHPVLTLHTRHLKEDRLLLSTFVHEEYHWYETAHPKETLAAIKDLKTMYPEVPIGGQDGALDEESSYLHIIVCYGEYEKMKELVGVDQGRQVMEFWATDHYRAIYRLVLENEAAVGAVLQRHRLFPPL